MSESESGREEVSFQIANSFTAHERRQLLVALLPNVKKLNGGAPISHTEREDAERAFIRKFIQEEGEKPERLG